MLALVKRIGIRPVTVASFFQDFLDLRINRLLARFRLCLNALTPFFLGKSCLVCQFYMGAFLPELRILKAVNKRKTLIHIVHIW